MCLLRNEKLLQKPEISERTIMINEMIRAYSQKHKRIIAPLMGYPGLQLSKQAKTKAQLDHTAHYDTIMALVDNFQPDIVFPLMDLSREVHALGRKAVFHAIPLKDEISGDYTPRMLSMLDKRELLDSQRFSEYLRALQLLSKSISSEQILCAYLCAPVTLAGMIMGIDKMALALLMNPESVHDLLRVCQTKLQNILPLLAEAGANAVCFLEPTASLLSPAQAQEFSLNYLTSLFSTSKMLKIDTIIHICGNTKPVFSQMADTGADILSLDSPACGINLQAVAETLPTQIIMGNLNPTGTLLIGKPEDVKTEVNDLLASMKNFPEFILSTGCDLPENTPIANIKAFFLAAREYKL
jgi:uroporphyrinogen decarboxylase